MERKVKITAHSGCEHTPANSLAHIQAALAAGADYFEVDVRHGPAGGLVLSHDLPAAGALTLEEAFVAGLAGAAGINCDLKEFGLVRQVLALAEECGFAQERLVFTGSFEMEGGDHAAFAASKAALFLNTELVAGFEENLRQAGQNPAPLRAQLKAIKNAGAACVNICCPLVNEALVGLCQSGGLGVSAWTADSGQEISRLAGLGVYNITTNFPGMAAGRLATLF
ncbi:MAG: glycerophosphodiester phosphodiesterase [Oscillospiraceae bacterium]